MLGAYTTYASANIGTTRSVCAYMLEYVVYIVWPSRESIAYPCYLLSKLPLIQQLIAMMFFYVFRWYFGKIKRVEAEKKLLSPENEHGAYLIRDSESRRNDYSLSGKM